MQPCGSRSLPGIGGAGRADSLSGADAALGAPLAASVGADVAAGLLHAATAMHPATPRTPATVCFMVRVYAKEGVMAAPGSPFVSGA